MDQPPSPPPLDRSALPEGQCRYILLVPGIKGQRCACAHFSHNQSTPGATCDCGHMACYHVKTAEQPAEKRELDLLKQRLEVVERQLDREQQGAHGQGDKAGRETDISLLLLFQLSKESFKKGHSGFVVFGKDMQLDCRQQDANIGGVSLCRRQDITQRHLAAVL
ncbi:hypothetical protein BN1723_006655 [Verticillium longisporum]|uniref:Uncharacterized protein n=1 Tax=Verticillium longisporum TaxID=100787 RepID=A0A0G4NGE9_VERLO|nr:hypothetical protein BN1723_006655 [Verticillium longisporum]